MKSKHKVPAFTILEVTIAMLIAAICMGIAFYVLNTFNMIFVSQQTERQKALMVQHLQHRLQKEAWQASQITFSDQVLSLETSKGLTQYYFTDSLVIRFQQDIPTDTISGAVLNIDAKFVKDIEQALVESFSFDLKTAKGTLPFVFHKQYSAQEFLSLNP